MDRRVCVRRLCERRGVRGLITSPAVANGKIIFATSDSSLFHVLDAETGKPVAKVQAKAFMFASPAVAGGVVYQGVLNGTLEARDLAGDAAIVGFDRQFGVGAIFSSPLVANGAIYLGSTDGNLYALE